MSEFDFERLRSSLENRDVEQLLGLYDRSATATVFNKHTPPSSPFQTSGWSEFETYIRDVCDRDLVHQVGNEVVGPKRVSYSETCTYPNGTKVVAANFLELNDGLITKQTVVETWDE
ncbi:MAG: nuclear transport factor 2 family protein [Acidimicrobiia bacterium]